MADDFSTNEAKQECRAGSSSNAQTKQSNEKLNSLHLADELHELASRALGLELAIIGAAKECQMNSYGDALAQLARDVALGLEALETKYFGQRPEEES
jgi:hypothetical protein